MSVDQYLTETSPPEEVQTQNWSSGQTAHLKSVKSLTIAFMLWSLNVSLWDVLWKHSGNTHDS